MKKRNIDFIRAACVGASLAGAQAATAGTLSFQDGQAGYTGTEDTWFSGRSNGEQDGLPGGTFIRTGLFDTGAANQQSVLKFNSVFGVNSGQVPSGSTITGATLTVNIPSDITYSDGEPNELYQMLMDWVETDAHGSGANPGPWAGGATGGIDTDGSEAASTPIADSAAFAVANMIPQNTTVTYDVTSVVQSWSTNAGTNFGFMLQSIEDGGNPGFGLANGNGLYTASSEYAGAGGIELRPMLTITGDFPGNTIEVEIDRGTGEIRMVNSSGGSIGMLGYSITSANGALDHASWTSIADNYDSDGDGLGGGADPGAVDSDNQWTKLSDPSSQTDLSEFELEGGDGGAIADSATISLGNAWVRSPYEDLEITGKDINGGDVSFNLSFVGNGGESFDFGDFNLDGDINASDWPFLRDNHLDDLSSLSLAMASLKGDMDSDGDNDEIDFALFKQAFDDAQGAGAFDAMISSVPEPSSLLLCGLGALTFLIRRRSHDGDTGGTK